MTDTIVGRVLKSQVDKPAHHNLLATKLSILPDRNVECPPQKSDFYASLGIVVDPPKEPIEMHIRGRHVLGGRRIMAEYETHSGVSWIGHYEILDDKGNVLHSDVSDD